MRITDHETTSNSAIADHEPRAYTLEDLHSAANYLHQNFGLTPEQFADEYARKREESVDIWDFDSVHAINSFEPLAFLRHALDKRVMERTEDGNYYLYTTEELQNHGERLEEVMRLAKRELTIVNIGKLALETTMDTFSSAIDSHMDDSSSANLTGGPIEFRKLLLEKTKEHNASAVRLLSENDKFVIEHGSTEEDQSLAVETNWGAIGVEGILKAFGMDVVEKESGDKFINGQIVEGEKDPENALEAEVFDVISNTDSVQIAGYNTKVVMRDNNQDQTELDAIGVKNGRLFHVEVKSYKTNPKQSLHTAYRQHTQLTPKTQHKDRYIVIEAEDGSFPEDAHLLKRIREDKIWVGTVDEFKIAFSD